LKDLEEENFNSPIFKDHIEYIDDKKYSTYYKPLKNQNKLTLVVRDYISGMSDKYFNEIYTKYNSTRFIQNTILSINNCSPMYVTDILIAQAGWLMLG
jgi:hypothetical protein